MKVMERWVVEVGNGMEETYLQRHKEWEPIDKRLGFPGEKRIYRSLAGPVAYCLPNLASAPTARQWNGALCRARQKETLEVHWAGRCACAAVRQTARFPLTIDPPWCIIISETDISGMDTHVERHTCQA
jgi:hypothetical protein